MGWDRGRYYTRSKKVNGRVIREYVGTGRIAVLFAQLDAITRGAREKEATAARAERERLQELEIPVTELNAVTDLLAQAALLAAGYRRHHRGEWRRKRAQPKSD
jgi:hypothetical protein